MRVDGSNGKEFGRLGFKPHFMNEYTHIYTIHTHTCTETDT